MGQALREIHQVYDDKLDGMRNELETYYNLKVGNLHRQQCSGRQRRHTVPFSSREGTCFLYFAKFYVQGYS